VAEVLELVAGWWLGSGGSDSTQLWGCHRRRRKRRKEEP